ncbi:MAG: sugar ABC transporter ATP-binding protein [Firmicutes bacterium]|nr:sugar ABC transporter ATP-binding protein [Bacillota bacterium]
MERPVLEVRGLTKHFPGQTALDGADLSVNRGEVHALLGRNGAGKSTLIRILAGVTPKDGGRVILDGREVTVRDPLHARQMGLSFVHQELNLFPSLPGYENLALDIGYSRTPLGLIDWCETRRRARRVADRMDLEFDLDVPAGKLSIAEQWLLAICRGIAADARVLILDEPTCSIGGKEVARLFAFIRRVKAEGVAVLYVSHRLNEVMEIADRATIIRDGRTVGTLAVAGSSERDLVRAVVGRDRCADTATVTGESGRECLRVCDITRGTAVRGVSFSLRYGEIVGLAGLVGSGRTELLRLIFGADKADRGEVYVDGRPAVIRSPANAIAEGLALVPEERRGQGLVTRMTVSANITLPSVARLRRWPFLPFMDSAREREASERSIRDLSIKCAGPGQVTGHLSGGNQQKVVLAKWLSADARVFLLDEPTKGVDVAAKTEIHGIVRRLASAGSGVLLVSSDASELVALSHRVLVMREGEIVAELAGEAVTERAILDYCCGGRNSG